MGWRRGARPPIRTKPHQPPDANGATIAPPPTDPQHRPSDRSPGAHPADGRVPDGHLTDGPRADAPLAALLLDAAESLNDELVDELEARGWPRLTRHRSLVFRHLGAGIRRPAALAAALDITRQSMQQLLEGLEADELVMRHPDPLDARAQVVSLTTRGEQLVHGAGVILAAIERRLAGAMGPDAVAELRDLSVRLLAAHATSTGGTGRSA